MNPITDKGADKYYIQQNMIPMELAGKMPKPPEPTPEKVDETVNKIADRDKSNILKAYRRDPAKFETFIEDYFRDFPEYMKKELKK